jgi:hypothetical protein
MGKQVTSSTEKKIAHRRAATIKQAQLADPADTLAEIDAVLSSAEEQTDRLMRRYDLMG